MRGRSEIVMLLQQWLLAVVASKHALFAGNKQEGRWLTLRPWKPFGLLSS